MTAVFDFLKKKEEVKKTEKKVQSKKQAKKPVKKVVKQPKKTVEKPKKTEEKPKKTEKPEKKKAKSSKLAYRVLIAPHVTEKSTYLAEQNKYVFKVFANTNKIEIKQAIQEVYDVKVENVKIINIKRKVKRFGKHQGFKKGYKKAIVKLKSDQKIDIISE